MANEISEKCNVEEWVTVSPEIAVLPDAKGYGKVYDLHQAMARDSSSHLQTLVNSYVAATDAAMRASLVEQILYAWTGTEAVSTTGRGTSFDGRKIQPIIGFLRDSQMRCRQKVPYAEQ